MTRPSDRCAPRGRGDPSVRRLHRGGRGVDAGAPGEVVGLLGANGAGKTTLIRMLLGLLAATEGLVEILGGPPDREHRRRLGYVPQNLGLYRDLTVAENLRSARGPTASRCRRCARGLAGLRRRPGRALPLGAQRQVAFVAALSTHPSCSLLDEPTSGVDALARARLWDTIRGSPTRGRGSGDHALHGGGAAVRPPAADGRRPTGRPGHRGGHHRLDHRRRGPHRRLGAAPSPPSTPRVRRSASTAGRSGSPAPSRTRCDEILARPASPRGRTGAGDHRGADAQLARSRARWLTDTPGRRGPGRES